MSIDSNTVKDQHETIGIGQPGAAGERTRHPDAQWFGNAGLGLFLHWGISAVRGEGDLSWSMMAPAPGSKRNVLERFGTQGVGRIFTPADYWAQADGFHPDRYDPNRWLAAAKQAGFKYAVLTTRHHDGYALWPSAYGEFGTRTHLGGLDLVQPYVDACRAQGLKVGLYYSPPDWYFHRRHMSFRSGGKARFPELPDLGVRHEPVTLPQLDAAAQHAWDERFNAYVRGQVEELLTRYGQIDVLWFDGPPPAITVERIRELQPGIVINPRAHGWGDFLTPEGAFPKERPTGWWEECHVWNEGGWGYRSHELYKPTGWVTAELARVRAWGGNLLLNVAPDAHGELPAVVYQRMGELAAWMTHSRESVVGTNPGPWPEQCNVPVTCHPEARYLHVSWVWDGTIELRGIPQPRSVRLLRTGEAWPYRFDNGVLRAEIPPAELSLLGEVLKVER